MFIAYGRLVKTLITITSKAENANSLIRDSKDEIVKTIERTKHLIPITKAVKIFGVTRATYHTWVLNYKLQCDNSFFKKCNRIYSNQITPVEIKAVKDALTNRRRLHWPINSIHLDGIRNKTISVSLNTVYKINKVLGIRNTKNRKRKKRHRIGIRALAPNKIWHADITILKTLDGVKHYIYLVMDNYSRYILSYRIENRLCGKIRAETIIDAYKNASMYSHNLNVDLIVDGGPENKNRHIDSLIKESTMNMKVLIA